MPITINDDRLDALYDYLVEEFWGDRSPFDDFEDIDSNVQQLLGCDMPTVFRLPIDCEAIAHTIQDSAGCGFVFGLQRRYHFNADEAAWTWAAVCDRYVESRDIEPRDPKTGDTVFVGGVVEPKAALRQVAENIAYRLNLILPAYQKLFGVRLSCRDCGEPCELDNPADPYSWVHAQDASDGGDHTARVVD